MKVKLSSIFNSNGNRAKAFLHFLSALIAVALTILLLSRVMYVLNKRAAYTKMDDFYSYPKEYDVWFMGSSHVIMGTIPEELWKSYGIRSYNMAEYGQGFPIDYWLIKNLIRIEKPKLIVLDALQINNNELYSLSNLGAVRSSMLVLPWSKEKLNMINALFEGDMKEEMIFPFSMRHNNWKQLGNAYYVSFNSGELGGDLNNFRSGSTRNMVFVTEIPNAISLEDYIIPEGNGADYFRKIIQLCRKENIQVLIVKSPHVTTEEQLQCYNGAYRIAQEEGIPFIDGFSALNLIDGRTDFWDKNHLNSSGARKWTDYLGKYIATNYPELCNSKMNDEQAERWEKRYANYLDWYTQKMVSQSSLYNYLMLASHPSYCVAIQIKAGTVLYQDTTLMALLDNIGYFPGLSDAAIQAIEFSGIVNGETGIVLDSFDLDGDIQITVFDEAMEMIDWARFDATGKRIMN